MVCDGHFVQRHSLSGSFVSYTLQIHGPGRVFLVTARANCDRSHKLYAESQKSQLPVANGPESLFHLLASHSLPKSVMLEGRG